MIGVWQLLDEATSDRRILVQSSKAMEEETEGVGT
jgi:hypothetical protein